MYKRGGVRGVREEGGREAVKKILKRNFLARTSVRTVHSISIFILENADTQLHKQNAVHVSQKKMQNRRYGVYGRTEETKKTILVRP